MYNAIIAFLSESDSVGSTTEDYAIKLGEGEGQAVRSRKCLFHTPPQRCLRRFGAHEYGTQAWAPKL